MARPLLNPPMKQFKTVFILPHFAKTLALSGFSAFSLLIVAPAQAATLIDTTSSRLVRKFTT